MILWRNVDETWMILMQTLMIKYFFCAILGNLDVSVLSPWWFFDDALERHCWNLDNFKGNFFDLLCSCCGNLWIIDFSLLVHWRLVDDSLEKHWCYREDFDGNIIDQKFFCDLISETLMFHCCFVDDSLMITWRKSDELASISM